jgi:hypothetical protein
MRIRNVWFDLLTFFGAAYMLACAVIAVMHYVRGEDGSFAVASLAAGIFLLLAVFLFRISLQLGNRQKRARERRIEEKAQRWPKVGESEDQADGVSPTSP